MKLTEGSAPSNFYLRCPTALERYIAAEVYFEALEDAANSELMDEKDIEDFMATEGLWSKEKDATLKTLETNIENLKVGIYQSAFKSYEKAQARKALELTRIEQARLLSERHAYDHLSCDGHANLARTRFLAGRCLVREDCKTQVWTGDSFWQTDSPLLDEIVQAYLRSRISEGTYRELARTEPWRSIWICRHAEGKVFGLAAAELTEEQRSLVVWTRVYDGAFESPECPPELIVSDDDAFDGWMILQRRERDIAMNKKQAETTIANEKIANSGEVFLFAETPDDARRIEQLNSDEAALIKKQRMALLNKKGYVLEAEMPDSKQRIMTQLMEMQAGRRQE